MPNETCLKLSPAARTTRNRLDASSKALILSAHKHKVDKPPKPPHKDNTSSNRFTLAELRQLIDAHYDSNNLDATSEDTEEDSTRLVNFTQAKEATPGDIRKILSVPNENGCNNNKKKAQVNKSEVHKPKVVIDGATYRAANAHITYSLSSANRVHKMSLIDRGANGGVAGDDICIISYHLHKKVDVMGIDNHSVSSIPVVTAGGVVNSTAGPAIVILHQHAHMGRGDSMHSSVQMEHFKAAVDDKSITVGGKQHIITNDDYVLPLSIKNGLPCITIKPCTDNQWDSLPHTVLTSDADWDPSALDSPGEVDDAAWYDAQSSLSEGPTSPTFNEYGELRKEFLMHNIFYFDAETFDTEAELEDIVDACVIHS